jgi:two-component sensor histidine kinase
MGQTAIIALTGDVGANRAVGADLSRDAWQGASESQLKSLRDIAVALGASASWGEAAHRCLQFALQLPGMDSGGVWLADCEQHALELSCFKWFTENNIPKSSDFDPQSPLFRLVAEGKPIFNPSQSLPFLVETPQTRERMRAIAILPLVHPSRVLGCLLVVSHSLDETPPASRVILEIMAAQLGSVAAQFLAERKLERVRSELDRQARDIAAERNRMDASIRSQAARLQIMREIGTGILAAQSPQTIAEEAIIQIRRLLNCSHASVVEFENRKQEAVFLAISSSTPSKLSRNYAMDKGAFPLDLLKNGQICCSDTPASFPDRSLLERLLIQEGAQSYMIVPLRCAGELIGTLNLGSLAPGFFDAGHAAAASEVALSLALAMRNTRMQKQTVKDAETKAILMHEMNHRVKNNLSAVLGLLFGAKRGAKLVHDTQHIALIDNLIGRIQGLATAHRLLSAVQWAPLSLELLSRQVVLACLHALAPGKNVALEIGACELLVTAKSANSLALILSELATNAIRHAIGERSSGRLEVRASLVSGMAFLEFLDDGPGYPEAVLRGGSAGSGLCLVQAMVRNDLQGTIALQNDGGAVARIRFKPDDSNLKLI